VEGYAAVSTYQLEIIPTASASATPLLVERPTVRGRFQPAAAPGEDPTDDVGLPSAEPSSYTIYLPVIMMP